MVLRLIEEDMPLDDIVFFDTGWEFPQMHEHIEKVEKYIGRKITRLHPHIDFEHWMLRRKIVARKGPMKGKIHRIGHGWPSITMGRWCTRQKIDTIKKHRGNSIRYIGIAADEATRLTSASGMKKGDKGDLYPLIEWDMRESDCLEYCYSRGFDWGGLYKHFWRVSCFCCPFKRLGELRTLRHHYSKLWAKMLAWEDDMEKPLRGFRGYTTVHELDNRFAEEDKQMKLF